MKFTRITGIIVSAVFALVAGIVAMRFISPHHVQKDEIISQSQVKFVNILRARSDINVGSVINSYHLEWVALPEENVFDGFIDDVNSPNAIEELSGKVVVSRIFKGDPIRLEKLQGHGNGGISSMLPKGKRAVSLEITPSSAAGGMIKPGDHVDVISIRSFNEKSIKSEVVLRNVIVIAIDQTLHGDDDQPGLIGNIATLELTPAQTNILFTAQQLSTKVSLVLRSIGDLNDEDNLDNTSSDRSDAIIIKSGVVSNKNVEGMPQ
ncbi:Flp pilus assembly protein CpaB [Candidatus Liberibacter brunswickensis]|uniref:Flp pilus assembly protein CpaB n=1 Tax=Candidatus Liberibacter brunswickensis TaxID=1968796 RepID=UPI002FE0E81E